MDISLTTILVFILIIGVLIFMQKCMVEKDNSPLVSTESSSVVRVGGDVMETLNLVNTGVVSSPTELSGGASGYHYMKGGTWKYVEPNGGAHDNINFVPKMTGAGCGCGDPAAVMQPITGGSKMVKFNLPTDRIYNVAGGSIQDRVLKNVIPTPFASKQEALGGYKRAGGRGLKYVSIGGTWHQMGN